MVPGPETVSFKDNSERIESITQSGDNWGLYGTCFPLLVYSFGFLGPLAQSYDSQNALMTLLLQHKDNQKLTSHLRTRGIIQGLLSAHWQYRTELPPAVFMCGVRGCGE